MNIQISSHEKNDLAGPSATHPSELRCGALAALLRLAGVSPQRCHVLPSHRIAAHSGAFHYRSKV